MVELERDKANADRQHDTSRKKLEEELDHRAKLEKTISGHKKELVQLKDRNAKLDRELQQCLTELKNREWDIKQLESRQDKTIVEHVHVLEEAKRISDRQLAEAQDEVQKQAAYIRSLEKAKTRLTGEAEDLARQREREQLELRTREKNARAQEERFAKANADIERERHEKDVAELAARRLEIDVQNANRRIEELEADLTAVQQSKENLEDELERLAEETQAPDSLAKFQREYEVRIAELESELEEERSTRFSAGALKDMVDRHHAEIRQLVMAGGPGIDSSFQSRLLREIEVLDDDLERKLRPKANHGRRSTNNFRASSSRRSGVGVATNLAPSSSSTTNAVSEKQVTALKQQVQLLELQVASSDRVRKHLENSLHDLTADLNTSDGSKQSLQRHREKLAQENVKLQALIADEADAHRTAKASEVDGVQAMWNKFQNTIDQERKNYARLEESRKALVSFYLL
jgi:myosin heavy chain 9/10/11/14